MRSITYCHRCLTSQTFQVPDEKEIKTWRKPKNLNQIWDEKDLCERLDLPVTKSGRSRQLSNWIRGGLKFVDKSERRYFFEQDVIDYLWLKREGKYSQ